MKYIPQIKIFFSVFVLIGLLASASFARAIAVHPDPLGTLGDGCSLDAAGQTFSGTVQWQGDPDPGKKFCKTSIIVLTGGKGSSTKAATSKVGKAIYNAFVSIYPDVGTPITGPAV